MYVVIGGAGEVGRAVATNLIDEGLEVAIVEREHERLARVESLDALVIEGNVASPTTLKEAGIEKADVLIAVTSVDEINLLACATARSHRVRTIARVNNADYVTEAVSDAFSKTFGADTVICPDLVAARRIARIFQTPTLLDTDVLGDGAVHILQATVNRRALASGRRIRDIALPADSRIMAVFRGGETILPFAETRLQPRDTVAMIIRGVTNVSAVGSLFGYSEDVTGKARAERVVVSGATRTGIDVARNLEADVEMVLVDPDEQRCNHAAQQLNKTMVLKGTVEEEEIQREIDLATADAFVALTGHEDLNILQCLLAKQRGAKVTVALLDRLELKHTIMEVGVDLPISARLATVNNILQFTQTVPSLLGLYVLHEGEARVLEVRVTAESKLLKHHIGDLKLPAGCDVSAVTRGDEFIIPTPQTRLAKGDKVVFFALADAMRKLTQLL